MERDLMAYLPAAAKFALTVAVGCACILEPLLGFVEKASPRSALLDAAVAVVLVALPVTYITGVCLVYVHVTPRPAAAPPPGAARRVADLACAAASVLLVALALPLAAFVLLDLAGKPPSGGFIPT